ncbi:SAV_915 family protein [Streptomyces sp. HF10]|uniref:SAV_915 family protein n=1 Tax=Streptomyces sp. HF10 TaxID=2692233 RepID=UPI001F1AB935|nr:SAV_915 family protein [Streptomyces sp. HF10]
MTAPIRSRLLDFVEPEPGPPGGEPAQDGSRPRRSALLDLAESAPPPPPAADGRPGPRPGVPPYHTPVCVPAHPRSVAGTGSGGRPARVPFIMVELFEHPTQGTVAFAFTSPAKLAAALGEAQPWVAGSLGPLAEEMDGRGVLVLLDPRVTPGEPNWRPEDLAALAREVRR